MQTRNGSRFTARLAAMATLSTLAAGQALAISFAPWADPEAVQWIRDTLESQRAASGRFTTTGSVRLYTGVGGYIPAGAAGALEFVTVDPREANPLFRPTRITWSVLQEGAVIETNPGTVFHADPVYNSLGQGVDPPDDAGIADNFSCSIRERLGGLPAPFGFSETGGFDAVLTIMRRAFLQWEQVAGLELAETDDSGQNWDRLGFGAGDPDSTNTAQGDIRIAMTWVDGAAQPDGTTGTILAYTYPPAFPLNPPVDEFDDNDTPDPDDDEINAGYLGNIILDAEDKWNDPAAPNLLEIVLVREIGFALGLLPSCPEPPTDPFSVLQEQVFNPPPTPGDPFPQLVFTTPQEDDIRAVQFLYGDRLEDNDSEVLPTLINYRASATTDTFTYAPHLRLPAEDFPEDQFPNGGPVLSIGLPAPRTLAPAVVDEDNFRIVLPDTVTDAELTITVQPVGTPFSETAYDVTTGACNPAAPLVNRNPIAYQNLRFTVFAFDPFTNEFTEVIQVNDAAAGLPETITLNVTSGTYFVKVEGDGSLTLVQLYEFTLSVRTPVSDSGIAFNDVLDEMNIEAFRSLGYFGANSSIGVVDGTHIADAHAVFDGRTIDRINWPGVQPAVLDASSHPTMVAGIAAGSPFGTFEGVAPEATLTSATVATSVFPDGTFAVGKNALYFALFGLADPQISASLGLANPVGVILSTWNAGSRSLNGEDTISQAFDAVGAMTSATIVVAAGNNGRFEGQSFTGCLIPQPDPDGPGADFLGSRSVVPPGVAYNVISVGAVGIPNPNDLNEVPVAQRDQLPFLVAGFSSRGPIDSADVENVGTDVPAARSGVDLVAMGTGILDVPQDGDPPSGTPPDPCDYNGPRAETFVIAPAIALGDDPENPATPDNFNAVEGSSVAAGIVAGAVALLQDVALDQSPALSTHPSVMKAVLMTGAVKLLGWTNTLQGPGKPQDMRDGFDFSTPENQREFRVTTRPLDLAQGAGVLDLQRSLEIFFTGYEPPPPPQAPFEGPWIDTENVTNPAVPTIRRPDEFGGGGGGGGGGGAMPAGDEPDPQGPGVVGPGAAIPHPAATVEPMPVTGEELKTMMEQIRGGPDTDLRVARPSQSGFGGTRDPDIKRGNNAGGTNLQTAPTVPFIIPNLGGGTPGGGGPGPGLPPGVPPGSTNNGAVPREIEAIFVDPLGWDHANIDQRAIRIQADLSVQRGFIDYVINVPLLGRRPDPQNPGGEELPGDTITITLCWLREFVLENLSFANPNSPQIGNIGALELENLDLLLFQCDSLGNIPAEALPVAQSISNFSNSEHLFIREVPQTSLYLIRVQWTENNYDTRDNRAQAEQQYGVAWRVDFSPRSQTLARAGVTDLLDVLDSFGGAVGNTVYEIDGDKNYDGKVDFQDVRNVLTSWAAGN